MHQPNQVTKAARPESYWSLMLASLRYRNFRLVWMGSFTEHLGEFMEIAAILWLVNELTHSPLMLTIVGSCRFVAMIFIPIASGVVADRVNRRNLLMYALLGSAIISTALAMLAMTGLIAVWHLIIISLLSSVAMSFNHPARATIVPNLIKREHLLNAISLDFLSVYASMTAGMLAAGYLINILGVGPIFIIRAVGCLIAIGWLLLATIPPTPPTTRKQAPWHNLVDGLNYLRDNVIMISLVVLFLLPMMVLNTTTNFIPIFASDILHVGAVGYGYLQSAPGLGAIISLLGLTLLTYYQHKATLLVVSGIIMGIGLIAFSASPWLYSTLLLLVVVGGMHMIFGTTVTTLIQNSVPDNMRGRVMSWREIAFGLGHTSSMLFGGIAQYTGVKTSVVVLGGICFIVSALLIIYLSSFRRIE